MILRRLDGPPQTNEPMRSAALCPGFLTVAALTGLPLVTSELGASAGLNQLWDRFAYRFGDASWGDAAAPVRIEPDWQGPPPPLPAAQVVERAGCDRAPPSIERPEDRLRLLSFVWADQTRAHGPHRAPPSIWRGREARDRRGRRGRLAGPAAGHAATPAARMWSITASSGSISTPTSSAAAGRCWTRRAHGRHAEAPLAWLRLEGDGDDPGAAITLTLWPAGETRLLGRANFHGAWVRWTGWT